jgi:small subunit ribosomal protein S4
MEDACRICRREQKKLFLKGERCFSQKCALIRRNYPAGQHGQTRRQRLSEYGRQLREKQEVKAIYGLSEENLRRIFRDANRKEGDLAENFLQLLERRIDNVLFRAGFFPSRKAARQAVVHEHIRLNEKKIKSPSLLVSEGDVISINKKLPIKRLPTTEPVPWISVDEKNRKIKILHLPTSAEMKVEFEKELVIESLSR